MRLRDEMPLFIDVSELLCNTTYGGRRVAKIQLDSFTRLLTAKECRSVVLQKNSVCMYVCVEHLHSHRQPYVLDCHGGAMGMYHCALGNTTDFSCTQN